MARWQNCNICCTECDTSSSVQPDIASRSTRCADLALKYASPALSISSMIRISGLIAVAAANCSLACMPSEYVLAGRSEEHTSELQSLMRISYAVFCLKKKKYLNNTR